MFLSLEGCVSVRRDPNGYGWMDRWERGEPTEY